MAYCTKPDVETAVGGPARLLELSDLAGNLTQDAAADAVVAAAIAEADGEIDMAIGHRYLVPLAVVPQAIKYKSAAWAARVLRRNCYNGQPLQDDLDREKTDREWLEKVGTGLVSLGIEPTPAPASIVNDKWAPRDSLKTVSRLKLRGSW